MLTKIDIEKLIVNPENYRFDPVDTQNQAIELMLEEKNEEIFNLAKHIIENGLDKAKNLRVVEIKKDLFKILEGNRRITAIKCLLDPSVIKSDSLKNKFKKLIDESKKENKVIPTKISCFIYKSEEEAAKWIKLDHTGKNKGVGLDEWGPAEKERFAYKFEGKISPAMQIVNLFEVETNSKIDKNKLKISTINRILSNSESRSYLGVDIKNGNLVLTSNKKEVLGRIDKLFNKMLTEDITVSEVYHTSDSIKFMKNLFGEKPVALKKKTVVQSKILQDKKIKKVNILPKTNGREVLIPYSCGLIIHEKKINNIYHELRNLSISEYTNAVAVLFRVFLETSLDCYAEKYGMQFNNLTKLSGKITKVADELEKGKTATNNQLKNIRNVATKTNSILSIGNFHEYVHSFKSQPIPSDLVYSWDNLQEFFEIIWGEISRKEGKTK